MAEDQNNINIVYSEEEILARVKEVAKQITEDYRDKQDDGIVVVGVLRGAVIFFSDLVKNLDLELMIDFIVASSYKNDTKSSGKVDLVKDVTLDIEGKHIIIVEDIIDTGRTLAFLSEHFANRNAASVNICALFDKKISKLDINSKYVCFDCPNEFVVGYGLDCAQKYRNLPYLRTLEN